MPDTLPFGLCAVIAGALVTTIGVLWKAWAMERRTRREDGEKRWKMLSAMKDQLHQDSQAINNALASIEAFVKVAAVDRVRGGGDRDA